MTILKTASWKEIMKIRETRKQLTQSRAEISNSAARAKQGRKAPVAKPKVWDN